MGHVNPAVCLPRKESWRWETTNSEYGKFYVRRNQREVMNGQELQNDCSKKCEELTNELLEAKAQLEKLKITCVRNSFVPERLQDTACQTSPTTPRPPSRKLYKTEKYNELEGSDTRMMLSDREKEDHSHLVKRVRPKLPLLKLRNGRSNLGDNDDHDNGEIEFCKPKEPLTCGMVCGGLESGSRSSISSGSAKGRGPPSVGKRKILQKQGGAPKKQKGSLIKGAASNLKHTAAGGANLPPSQRYTFYRNFGYGGQGAKTSKGWHSKTSPWMPT
ncbi:hypothetical protein M758_3G009000 [Ceratodon purpureus]|nr:hypothetical protein M758_3G009000 [Ceratodon purpureus]